MNKQVFSYLGTAILLLAGTATATAQERRKPVSEAKESHHMEMMQACAKACSDCARECDHCTTHCAKMLADGKKDHLMTLRTCQDCANFCTAAAQIVARGGPFVDLICHGCAEACDRCAKACEKFPDDEHMKKCAAECKKCEKACKDMLSHSGAAK